MAKNDDEKRYLIEELARSRLELTGAGMAVRQQLNVGDRLSYTFRRHSWSWMTVAAMVGWVLSRLPGRKKKIYLDSTTKKRIVAAKTGKRGFFGHLWSTIWSIARPILTGYLIKRLGDRIGVEV